MSPKASVKPSAGWVRMVVDYAGLAGLAVGYLLTHNLLTATFAFVVVSLAAVLIGFVVERKVAPLPLLFSIMALVFGVATLVFHDPRIIKMKTTVLDGALGLGLLVGFALGKSPVKLLLGSALQLTEAAWRRLTLRYGLFFLALAVVNEIVWRTQSDAVWVLFRMPGMLVLSLLFSATQIPGMVKSASAFEAAVRLSEPQE
ncbi:inner membrane-spanning protein YciB [Caulobacter sp. S45]|uniref:inner membrane-spanning protein YciB n=1 Tax=Caulobacter sp. S45 TaxID=1641861 RepID=UPI001575A14C|nr:septation protein IspZ [Caulobacter sp. S45]